MIYNLENILYFTFKHYCCAPSAFKNKNNLSDIH